MIKCCRCFLLIVIFCILNVQGAYAESGFILETMKVEVPEILWGRYPETYDDEEIRVAEIVFIEKERGAWQVEDGIVFSVPEGVKLRGAEVNTIGIANGLTEQVRLVNSSVGPLAKAGIRDSVWRLSDQEVEGQGLTRENDGVAGVRVQLWVSVIPDYEGDISVGVWIDGVEVANRVVAKVIPPFTIEGEQWIGHDLVNKNIFIPDIKISEIREGSIKTNEDGKGVLIIGMEYISIEQNSASVTIVEGDLTIGKLYYRNHAFGNNSPNSDNTRCLFIEIEKESTIPSTIMISGIAAHPGLGAYPNGDIALRIGGNLIENFGSFLKVDYATFGKAFSSTYSPIDYWAGSNDIRDYLEIGLNSIEMRTNDGKFIPLPVAPYYNEKGILMVPLKIVAESLGATVEWDSESKKVELNVFDNLHNQYIQPYSIINNTAMISLKELCENFLHVPMRWDDATETAYVTLRKEL